MAYVTSERAMAPGDALSWAVTIHPDALSVGERIGTGTWSLPAADTAIGARVESLGVVQDADFGWMAEGVVWIDAAEQAHVRWDGATGTVIRPRCLVETTAGERYDVEVPIRVARSRLAVGEIGHRVLVLGDPRG